MLAKLDSGRYIDHQFHFFEKLAPDTAVLITDKCFIELVPSTPGPDGVESSFFWTTKNRTLLSSTFTYFHNFLIALVLHTSTKMISPTMIAVSFYPTINDEGQYSLKDIETITLKFVTPEKAAACFAFIDSHPKIDLDKLYVNTLRILISLRATDTRYYEIPTWIAWRKNKRGDVGFLQKGAKGSPFASQTVKISDGTLTVNKRTINLSDYHAALDSAMAGHWSLFNSKEALMFASSNAKEASDWLTSCVLGGSTLV